MPSFLNGEKVKLRTFREDDLKQLFEWENSPESRGEFGTFRPIDWYNFERKYKDSRQTEGFVIEEQHNEKKPIGTIYHHVDERHPYRVGIGYEISDVNARGKGYATEATKLLVDYLFSNKNIERIQTTVDVSNIASQKVLEKNGFKREGTLKSFYLNNGKYHDHYGYAILREDWEALRK